MDAYLQAYIKVNVHIDAAHRVWCKNEQLEVHVVGNERKVVLPISKQTFTFDELKQLGARVDVDTRKTLAQYGAEGRWREEIERRRKDGLPPNVYIANARSIDYAVSKGKVPPPTRYVGRMQHKITEVYDTVDEVVAAIIEGRWRTEFSRGRYSKKRLELRKSR